MSLRTWILVVLVFLPTEVFWLSAAVGIISPSAGQYALATVSAVLQGWFLLLAALYLWWHFREHPERLALSSRAISVIDYLLIGALLTILISHFFANHGRH